MLSVCSSMHPFVNWMHSFIPAEKIVGGMLCLWVKKCFVLTLSHYLVLTALLIIWNYAAQILVYLYVSHDKVKSIKHRGSFSTWLSPHPHKKDHNGEHWREFILQPFFSMWIHTHSFLTRTLWNRHYCFFKDSNNRKSASWATCADSYSDQVADWRVKQCLIH